MTTFSEFMLPKMVDKDGDLIGDDEDADGNVDWDWWAPLTGIARPTVVVEKAWMQMASKNIALHRQLLYVDARVNRLRFDQGAEDPVDLTDPTDTQQQALPMMLGGSQLGWDNTTSSYLVDQYPCRDSLLQAEFLILLFAMVLVGLVVIYNRLIRSGSRFTTQMVLQVALHQA